MEEFTEKQISNAILDILMDVNNENKKIISRQTKVIVFLISLLFASFCSFLLYLNQFDIESTVTTTTTTDNNSKINNSQNTNAQNNINVNLPKIKK